MPFTREVVVTPIPPERRRWRLVEPLEYVPPGDGRPIEVPAGFETDFASVPRVFVWLLPRYGHWTPAAVLHDHLWALAREGGVDKVEADDVFRRAMLELDVPFLRRWIMWAAVRWAAGPASWWAGGGVRVLQMLAISVPALLVVAAPALVILVALLVGATAEYLLYPVLRLATPERRAPVNRPEAADILRS